MPSPPRPFRHSPPRKPLHERSESSTNERVSPTLRIIGDPHAPIYSSTPYPTLPSHILPPKSTSPSRAVPGKSVSEGHDPTGDNERFLRQQTLSPTANSRNKKDDPVSTQSKEGSFAESWPAESSRRPFPTLHVRPGAERGYNTAHGSFTAELDVEEEHPSDEVVQLPSLASVSNRPYSELFTQHVIGPDYQQPVAPRSSDNSLSSSGSAGTVIRKQSEQPTRPFYSVFPNFIRPGSSKSNSTRSSITPVKANPVYSQDETSPVSPVSPISAESSAAYSQKPSTSHRAVSVTRPDAADSVQYPVIRPPTASESWAQSTEAPRSRSPLRNPFRSRWRNPLSTVESVGMTDRSSGSQHLADSSLASRNSTRAANSRSETPPLPAHPLASHPLQRSDTGSTIRMVNEDRDAFNTSLAPVPGSRSSNRFSIFSKSSRGSGRRQEAQGSVRPSSRGSFFRDSIPAWAKTYYGRGARNSILPQNYSTDNIQETGANTGLYPPQGRYKNGASTGPYNSTDYSTGAYTTDPSASETSLAIHQPRTRPHDAHIGHSRNDSIPITRIRPSEISMVEIRGEPRPKISQTWSPHLWQHRASAPARRSLFIAPAIDREAVSRPPKRRNAQILLFTIGFVFPLAWFVAAFLPLPSQPPMGAKGKDPERHGSASSVGQELENRLAPMDVAQYENARWWRNLNRMMMIVGVFVIVAIVRLSHNPLCNHVLTQT